MSSQQDRDRVWERRGEHSADNWTYHPVRTAAKYVAVILVAIFLLSVFANALGITSVYWGAKKAEITVNAKTRQKVNQPDNQIAQIAFFHDQCEGVNAQAKIVRNNELRLWSDQKAAEIATDPIHQQQALEALSQDATDVAGSKNVLQQRAADYNSRSAQSTANIFKGHGLPARIDVPSSDEELAQFSVDCGPTR